MYGIFNKKSTWKTYQKKGTVQYNSASKYSTLGLIYENHDKYELFLSIRIINKISISYLMDYSIEMFLSIVVNLILEKQNTTSLSSKEFYNLLILSIQINAPQFNKIVRKNHFYSIYYEFVLK